MLSADAAATLTDLCQSLPFGDQQSCGGPDSSPMHFTGQERDPETGLDHFMFRQYSSTQGRWLTPDPAGLGAVDPANPQTWNRYAYVTNNPVNAVDPLGLTICSISGSGEGCKMSNPGYTPASSGGSYIGSNFGATYTVDGVPVSASLAGSLLHSGVAAICPHNNCSQIRYTADGTGRGVIQQWVPPAQLKYKITYVDNEGVVTTAESAGPMRPGYWSTVGIVGSSNLSQITAANNDVPVGWDIWHNSPQCPKCAGLWQQSSMTADRAMIATGILLVGVPVVGEAAGAIAACDPGLNTANYGHVTVYCRAWMPGNLIGIGYDPRNGLHINVGGSIHIPLWPWR